MKNTKSGRLIILLAIISTILFSSFQIQEKEKGWIRLFNGKDLKDWRIKITGYDVDDNYNNTFRVENGLLKVRYDQYEKFNGEFGLIIYKKSYSHYKLRVEYRFTGKQLEGGPTWTYLNSGIMIHSQSPESMEKDQRFPTSIEVQLLGGDATIQPTNLNACTPGTNIVMNGELVTEHCTNSKSKTYNRDEWITAEVEVRGDSIIKHIIDGEVVLQYSKPQLDERDPTYQKLLPPNGDKILHGGYISFQSESQPIDFRKIELLNLGDDCD